MTLLSFNSKYVVASTTAVTTTSATLVDDTEAIQTFDLAASKVVLVIYQANNVYGAAMPIAGMQNAINVDGTDRANSWDSRNTNGVYPARNTVFWVGTLAAGSHTIKGRFASNLADSTATISNRVLVIIIFDGDEFQYIDNATTATTGTTTFVDDPNAQVTFTPSATCKALILYNIANSGATEATYGKKAAINVAGTDYGQAEKTPDGANYSDSVFTCHALSLSAVSTTVKGRFAANGGSTVSIHRRELAVLLLADSTLLDIITSTTQVSTTSSSLVDDTQATISRTTSDTRELLVVAMGTKRDATSSSGPGECYGVKVDANDRANSRGSPRTSSAANSAGTAYAEQLAAGSHTVQGRFSNNTGANTAKIDARQVIALWFSIGVAPTEKAFSDNGLGSETFVNPYRAMPFADAGHGAEAFNTPFRTMGFVDVGSGVDIFALLRMLTFSDSGLGSDSFSKEILGAILKAFADAGLGSDAFLIPFKALGFLDSGYGAESFSKIITFLNKTFADGGYGVDAFIIPYRAMGFSDVGHGTDAFLIVFRTVFFSDTGWGSDSFGKYIPGEVKLMQMVLTIGPIAINLKTGEVMVAF